MGPGSNISANAQKPMGDNREVQLLDRQAVEAACAALCKKFNYDAEQGIACEKVFGVMAAFADNVKHTDFHFSRSYRDVSAIPLPFEINPLEQVYYLNEYDGRAERLSYLVAQELFAERWRPSLDSVLIVACDLSWALMINESGGIFYWREGGSQVQSHA